jgi:succinate dehydrogenase / fumarate reductase flavoprotein subunit
MKELAPRDLVARAIESEIREGRGVLNPDHNIPHVWIDLRHLPDDVHEKQIPEVSSFFKRYVNLDPQQDLCPVRPSNHYHMGGIPTNEFGEVEDRDQNVIDGLFAVGECAASSFHGFNRLGTNSILELITMGKIAADRIMERFHGKQGKSVPDMKTDFETRFNNYFTSKGEDNIGLIRNTLRRTMTNNVSVFRTENSIVEAIEMIRELHERSANTALASSGLSLNQELVQRWELDNLLHVSMVICEAALARQESRGAHFRDDFPVRKDQYNYHTLVSMPHFGKTTLDRREINRSLFDEGQTHFEKFDFIERKY